jgi:hypothetical protein
MTGKSGWNCVKYVWMHIFYHLSEGLIAKRLDMMKKGNWKIDPPKSPSKAREGRGGGAAI